MVSYFTPEWLFCQPKKPLDLKPKKISFIKKDRQSGLFYLTPTYFLFTALNLWVYEVHQTQVTPLHLDESPLQTPQPLLPTD